MTTNRLNELRRFHCGLPTADAPELPEGLLPVLLHPYRGTANGDGAAAKVLRSDYPVFLPPADGDALPLPFGELLERALPAAGGERLLADNRARLERAVRREMADAAAPVAAREVLSAAGAAVRRELDLPAEDDRRLAAALDAVAGAVPAGELLPWGAAVPLHLLLHAVRNRLRPAREAFLEEARQLAAGLTAVLDAGTGRKDDLGSLGSRFIDPSRLAGLTTANRGRAGLSDERRARLAAARETLDRFIANGATPPVTVVGAECDAPEGCTAVASDAPFAAAAGRFDAAAEELAAVLRALRTARLELAGDYDPARHGPVLERLDWRGFSRREAALLAPVVAVADADHAAGDGLAALSRLLLSGRPVQALVRLTPAASPGESERLAGGFRFEPASLGVGHREAFVQQSSLARPVHLAAGLARALDSGRAALHVVDAVPATGDGAAATLDPWLRAGAALEARAHPLFVYDPEAGEGWARRLDFSRNPEPQRDWPCSVVRPGDVEVKGISLVVPFTFADYALLEPALAGHFRLVDPELEDDDLVPLVDWLDAPDDDAVHRLPWIFAAGTDGALHRLLLDRPLAHACRDRLDYWHTLQEMAGVRSEYAARAADEARRAAAEDHDEELERLRREHAEELERVRRDAAEEVANRLTAALLEVDVSGLPPVSGTTPGLALGGDVDQVARTLLAAVEADGAGPEAASAEVEAMTARLLGMLDLENDATNPAATLQETTS